MSDAAPPRLIYIIRHAEKPNGPNGPIGIDIEGNPDPHSLVPRGWQRSGALGVLFTAGVGALVTPDHLICPDCRATTPVHRTYQTLLGLADLAGAGRPCWRCEASTHPSPRDRKPRWRRR
jgi:hypothetical protein